MKTDTKFPVINVLDGKYTFFIKEGDYEITCLRYGETWLKFSEGCGAILGLMYMIEELKEKLTKNK